VTFNYQEISTTSVDGHRWYDTPVGWMPSITTVLGATTSEEKRQSLQSWRDGVGHKEADLITQEAADHGTILHLLCERHLKGQVIDALIDGEPVPEKALKAYRAIKLKLRDINAVWGQEVALYSKEVEVAGRADVIGVYRGVPCVIDFKSSRRIKSEADIADYCVQLAFYGKAHNEMFGTNIEDGVVLMSSADGFPQEFRFTLAHHYLELSRRAASYWLAAVNTCA
jgi:ATP-dependent exoDNAse (exonuclease V) beta subunit